MNNEKIVYFLKENTAISLATLEKEAGLSAGLLGKVIRAERQLNDNHIQKLMPLLLNYGFQEFTKKITARVISVLNLKGGVGKTTTTINLGKALSLQGKKVLLIDSDPQANLTEGLGIQAEKSLYHAYKEKEELPIVKLNDNFHVCPSELNLGAIENEIDSNIDRYYVLSDLIVKKRDEYDFILIDCPPSLGVYTINAIVASTHFISTVQAASYAVSGLHSVWTLIEEKIKKRLNTELQCLGILITFVTKTIVNDTWIEALKDEYQNNVFTTSINQTIKFQEASTIGTDIFSYDASCQGAKYYEELGSEVLKRLK